MTRNISFRRTQIRRRRTSEFSAQPHFDSRIDRADREHSFPEKEDRSFAYQVIEGDAFARVLSVQELLELRGLFSR